METTHRADRDRVVFRLTSMWGHVTSRQLVDDRLLRCLFVEDVGWKFASDAWQAHRPSWWQRDRRQ